MATFIDRVIAERRTLQQALADIRAKNEKSQNPELADMIQHGEAEIFHRATNKPVLVD